MPQLLKQEVRNSILDASKKEFFTYGYENASMRRIAFKAKMTVGNLYRYYDSKAAINEAIVEPVVTKINEMVKNVCGQEINIRSYLTTLNLNKKKISKMFDEIADGLVDIYEENKEEFTILLMQTEVSEAICEWFTSLIIYFIDNKIKLSGLKKEKNMIARIYSVSLFSGVREIFKNYDLKPSYLKNILKVYLKSYTNLSNIDVKKMVGGR